VQLGADFQTFFRRHPRALGELDLLRLGVTGDDASRAR
jgi:hypothetical protein